MKAAVALGEIGDKRAVEPLTQALKDENSDVRMKAKLALEGIEYIERLEKKRNKTRWIRRALLLR